MSLPRPPWLNLSHADAERLGDVARDHLLGLSEAHKSETVDGESAAAALRAGIATPVHPNGRTLDKRDGSILRK